MWSGMLGFGLVQIPIMLFKATDDHDVGFNQFHGPDCLGSVGRKMYCKKCQAEVDNGGILRGKEVDGKLVIVSDDELAQLEGEGNNKQIEILQFVDRTEIHPIMYESSYYVGTAVASKAYALLAQSMVARDLFAVAQFTLRTKTTRAALEVLEQKMPDGEVRQLLVLHRLRWPDEVRAPEVPGLGGDFSAAEMKAALQVVESYVDKFNPDTWVDEPQRRLKELIAAKVAGAPFVAEPAVDLDATEVDDMVAQLQASIRRHPAGKKRPARKAPARQRRTA
jgi:DNA end-binding protein Ku